MAGRTEVRIPSGHLENEIHFQREARPEAGIQSRFPMNTLADISAPKTRRTSVSRRLLWLLLGVVLVVAGAIACAYYVGHSALPQLDGRLPVSGLTSMVTVTRDGHGVPTIEAAGLEDLFFAQGYVTAQDRLWQMDVLRRFGGGELS
jgi:penicillin amidase